MLWRRPWLSRRRRLAAVALAVLAIMLIVPSLRMNYAHPAFGFAGETPGVSAPGTEEGQRD